MFKTHINNLPQIKAAATHYGTIWFHGDGNIYHKQGDSDFRKDFSNDKNGPETYRVKFNSGDRFPETLEELHVSLLSSKTKELQAAQLPQSVTGISTFKVHVDEVTTEVDNGATGNQVPEDTNPENVEKKS